jgi:hypothetical protein
MPNMVQPNAPQSVAIIRTHAEALIEECRGYLEPVPGHPTAYCVPPHKAVTTTRRQQITGERRLLERRLAPCTDRKHVEGVVSALLACFDIGQGPSDEAIDWLDGQYAKAVEGLPFWAIRAKAERFRSGETILPWNRRCRPTTVEFRAEIRASVNDDVAATIWLDRLLGSGVAHVPTEEEQAKVTAAAASWLNRGGEAEAGRPHSSPEALAAAREDALHEMGAQFREAAVGSLVQLAARIKTKAPA